MSTQRRTSGITLLALAMALPVGFVPQPARGFMVRPHRPNRSAQQQITQVEEDLRTALLTGDTAGMEKYLAEDFVGISSNGKLSNKQQYLRRVSRRENNFSSIEVVDRKIRLQPPSTAVVTSTARVTGTLDGTPTRGIFRYTRVYNRQGSGVWKVVNFEATRVSGASTDEDLQRGIPMGKVASR